MIEINDSDFKSESEWGNSLGVRIPKAVIEKVNLSENSEVKIESKNGTIVIIPTQKKYSLDALFHVYRCRRNISFT